MISIGIFTGYYPYTMAEVIRRIGAEAEEIIGGLGAFVAG